MSPDEVEQLFGVPDTTYTMIFGEKTAQPWTGTVWKYYMDQDPSYQYCRRPLVNSFVFWNESTPPRLNHYELESLADPSKKVVKFPRDNEGEARPRGGL